MTRVLSTGISKPEASDCLFGRGKAFQNHPGNKTMHRLVDESLVRYVLSNEVSEKNEIIDLIVRQVKNGTATSQPGRFLKRCAPQDEEGSKKPSPDKTTLWEEVSDVEATKKVGHTIRSRMRTSPIVKRMLGQQDEHGPRLGDKKMPTALGRILPSEADNEVLHRPQISMANVLAMRNRAAGVGSFGSPAGDAIHDQRLTAGAFASSSRVEASALLELAGSFNNGLPAASKNDSSDINHQHVASLAFGPPANSHPELHDRQLLLMRQRQQEQWLLEQHQAQQIQEQRQQEEYMRLVCEREEHIQRQRRLLEQQQQQQQQQQMQQMAQFPDLSALSDEDVLELLHRSRMNQQLRLQQLRQHQQEQQQQAASCLLPVEPYINTNPGMAVGMQPSQHRQLSMLAAQQQLQHQQMPQPQMPRYLGVANPLPVSRNDAARNVQLNRMIQNNGINVAGDIGGGVYPGSMPLRN